MRLLLDTHTFLWFTLGDPQISAAALAAINDSDIDKLVSPVTYWEIAIKVGLKNLTLSSSYVPFMTKAITGYGLTVLPITFNSLLTDFWSCSETETPLGKPAAALAVF